MALSAGQAYVDIVPKVDPRDLKRQGLSIGKTLAAGIAAAAAVDFLKDSVAAARESRQIAAVTASAIKATGGAANLSSEQVAGYAEELASLTGVDDELIQKGENLLLTFRNIRDAAGEGNDIFKRATEAGLDLAAQGFGSVESNAIQLGKALNDPIKGITALQRAGVTFTQTQRDQIKAMVDANDTLGAQRLILDEIEAQVGGAAEAAADPMAKLSVTVGNLQESVGEALLPSLDNLANRFTSLSPAAQENIVKFGLMATGAGILVVGLGKVVDGVGSTVEVIGKVTSKMGSAIDTAGGFGSALKKLGPTAAAGGAVAGLTALVVNAGVEIAESRRQAEAFADELTSKFDTTSTEGMQGAVEALTAEYADQSEKLQEVASRHRGLAGIWKTTLGLLPGVTDEFGQQTDLAVALADALADLEGQQRLVNQNLVNAQHFLGQGIGFESDDANAAITMADALHLSADALEEVARRADIDLTKPWLEIRQPLLDAARAQGEQVEGMLEAKDAAEKLDNQIDRLTARFDRYYDKHLSAKDATAAFEGSLDALRASLKANGDTLDLNTEKGRANHGALTQIVRDANAATEANYKQNHSVREANQLAESQRERLREVADRLGLTKKQVKDYEDAIRNVPRSWKTKVTADTADASAKVAAFRDQLLGIKHGSWEAVLRTRLAGAPEPRAAGGPVRPGQMYQVGEKGPELFMPSTAGTVVDANTTARMSGGVTINGDINITSSDRPTSETLVSALRREAFLAGW